MKTALAFLKGEMNTVGTDMAVSERLGASPALRVRPEAPLVEATSPKTYGLLSLGDIVDHDLARYSLRPTDLSRKIFEPDGIPGVPPEQNCIPALLKLAGDGAQRPVQFRFRRERVPSVMTGLDRDQIFHFDFEWERSRVATPAFHRLRITLPNHAWTDDGDFDSWSMYGRPGPIHSHEVADDQTRFHRLFASPTSKESGKVDSGPGHILHSIDRLIGQGASTAIRATVAAQLIALIHPDSFMPKAPSSPSA